MALNGNPEPSFVLYGTAGCHLCEIAEGMLEELQRHRGGFGYSTVDISASDDLFRRYGIRIPVLRHPDGRELGWPFSAGQLAAFVG